MILIIVLHWILRPYVYLAVYFHTGTFKPHVWLISRENLTQEQSMQALS